MMKMEARIWEKVELEMRNYGEKISKSLGKREEK